MHDFFFFKVVWLTPLALLADEVSFFGIWAAQASLCEEKVIQNYIYIF